MKYAVPTMRRADGGSIIIMSSVAGLRGSARDLADFWPPEAIVAEMTAAGFADVLVNRDHRRNERNLATFLEGLRRRSAIRNF
ncbi:MAG TPA: hypothetical protein VHY78_07665 [Stellaceae bacterium]|nr:hypothetical protein [Stellaceae bacterium]